MLCAGNNGQTNCEKPVMGLPKWAGLSRSLMHHPLARTDELCLIANLCIVLVFVII